MIGIIVVVFIFKWAVLGGLGTEIIVPKVEEMTPFSVDAQTNERLVLSATLPFANEGKQCGTIMDAILRVQLPYEQYDGAVVRGKVELAGVPREDDYFEAVLIQKHERIDLVLKLSIEARNDLSLAEAVAHMVDFRMDLIYQETGRTPVHYEKAIIMMGADEIAALAGVELQQEGGAQHG